MNQQELFSEAAIAAGCKANEIITDSAELEYLSTDVYRSGSKAILAVRPESVASLSAIIKLAKEHKLVVVPRGGGASYSDGYVGNNLQHVLLDLRGLSTIEIDDTNATVTVGAGVTWAELKTKLDAHGWRTPFWGPFSGIAATIGGSVSQNAVSHGSGAHGISAASVLSMEIVLANGEVLTTGAAAAGGPLGVRNFGPDLTGLFTGDCGALGVKASITMPLLRSKSYFRAASFSFPDFESLHSAMRASSLEGLDDENFALDAALSQGQLAKEKVAGRYLEVISTVVKNHGLVNGPVQLLKMALAGDKSIQKIEYACHYILEGCNDAEVKAKLLQLRKIMAPFGIEIMNTIPSVVRGMPFAPLFNTLGPAGERWVPLHGVLSHEKAPVFHHALQKFYGARQEEMQRLGIWTGGMFTSIGSSGFLYEIAIYWPDARSVYHEREVDADYLASLPVYDDNPEARSYVDRLKSELIDLYVEHGASFFQIGRAYEYRQRMNPAAEQLLSDIKASLDSDSVMNPGVIGLGQVK